MPVTGDELFSIDIIERINCDNIPGASFETVSIDSRTMEQGEVFFAIRGAQHDGHSFVNDIASRAGGVVVDEVWWKSAGADIAGDMKIPVIVVKDTVKALGQLGRICRKKFSNPVIAVTGSSGKTTTKDMIAAVLETTFNVHRTVGNYNNHLGLPLTLCGMTGSEDVSVVEIGMNQPGEIEYLCGIAEPTQGLVTNIGKGHIGYFGSIEDVAKEKGMLYRWLSRDRESTAYVNADDERVVREATPVSGKYTYGFGGDEVDVEGALGTHDENGCYSFSFHVKGGAAAQSVSLPVPGKHHTHNALAAAAVGLKFGIAPVRIASALEEFTATARRSALLKVGDILIFDDSYNANPDSMICALETFREMQVSGKKILVFGDMLELGGTAGEEHAKIGLAAVDLGFEYVYTFGSESEALFAAASTPFGGHYNDKDKLTEELSAILQPGDAVLVKGSRGMKMEEVVEGLKEKVKR